MRTDTLKKWPSKVLTSGDYLPGSLIASSTELYVIDGRTIERIDPATGAVSSHVASPAPRDDFGYVSAAGGRVWFATTVKGRLMLYRYSGSLRRHKSITLSHAIGQSSPVTTSAPTGSNIYVADQRSVYRVQVRTLAVARLAYRSNGHIQSIGLSPDGTTLYVAVSPRPLEGHLDAIDLETGSSRRLAPNLINAGAEGVVPSSDGVWSTTTSGGHGVRIDFQAVNGTDEGIAPGYETGVSLSVVEKVAWVGLIGVLACYNADTGAIVARTRTSNRHAVVGPVVSAAARDFALVQSSGSRLSLLRITPPPACRPR